MTPATPDPSAPDLSAPASAEAADWQTVRRLGHDLNNFIGAISGYAELLQDDAPADGALAADLGRIREAAKRAAEVVVALRTLAKRNTGSTSPPPGE
jgi:signal transduction histidine kinase